MDQFLVQDVVVLRMVECKQDVEALVVVDLMPILKEVLGVVVGRVVVMVVVRLQVVMVVKALMAVVTKP